ncbi:Xyloglucan galactosyltransferase KATAMARI1-like protein [Rhynchospora pubera]|uniref:Xyloglucan galactosyltransferase KATAMARI1-like protein n=1 Tax=Rhynchospora pubera TaxID=906938 RepID=A0AAV8BXX9_9POAL|nr:Xyloglucan galactosyltransferase KATAMARI1-like protein [Rhynchospora pubera]
MGYCRLSPSSEPKSKLRQRFKVDRPISPPEKKDKITITIHLTPFNRAALVLSIITIQIVVHLYLSTLYFSAGDGFLPLIPVSVSTSCKEGLVYVYDLPKSFNTDLLRGRDALDNRFMIEETYSNDGFGPHVSSDFVSIIPSRFLSAWYATDQFAAEQIFHRRMLNHPCRTSDPTIATAFYIPFYVGLAVDRHLWNLAATPEQRDQDCSHLLRWLQDQPPFRRSNGWDHFLTISRITWNFRRQPGESWGSSFLVMPGMQNVTRLIIERSPWDSMDVAIPYPTSFHPHSAMQLQDWQNFVLEQDRRTLFGFAGAARPKIRGDFRSLINRSCEEAGSACRSVDCSDIKCLHGSAGTLELFLDSDFCLQPKGDSPTRRSVFDCMIAGAVPVFFWRETTRGQHSWFFPKEGGEDEWSVFIDRKKVRRGIVNIRKFLEGIGEEKLRKMRERVVDMIPRLVYAAGARGLGEGMEDAFDMALKGIFARFKEQKKRWR